MGSAAKGVICGPEPEVVVRAVEVVGQGKTACDVHGLAMIQWSHREPLVTRRAPTGRIVISGPSISWVRVRMLAR